MGGQARAASGGGGRGGGGGVGGGGGGEGGGVGLGEKKKVGRPPKNKVAVFFFSSLLLSSLELRDTKVYEPQTRALLVTAAHLCKVFARGCCLSSAFTEDGWLHPRQDLWFSIRFQFLGKTKYGELPCI